MGGGAERVLVVQDEQARTDRLTESLKKAGFQAVPCLTPEDAARQADMQRIDVAVVAGDDLEFLKAFRSSSPATRVIVHSRHASLESAKRAVRLGAFGFVDAGDGEEELAYEIKRALAHTQTEAPVHQRVARSARSTGHLNVGPLDWQDTSVSSLSRILEESLNEIFVFDAQTLQFLYCNRGARKNLGYSAEELHRLTPNDLKPEINGESFRRLIQPLRDGRRELIVFETVHRRKDHTEYPVEVHLQLTEWNQQTAFVAIILDITKRKSAESKLRMLAALVEHSRDLIGLATPEGKITYLNQAGCDLVGLTNLEEARTTLDSDYVSPEDIPWLIESTLPTLLREGTWVGEYGFRHFCTGKRIPLDINSFIIADGERSTPAGIGIVARDITDRKRAAEALGESEQRFRKFIEQVPFVVWMAVPGRPAFTYVNPAFEAVTGLSHETLTMSGHDWLRCVHGDDRSMLFQQLRDVMSGRSAIATEFRIVRPDGVIRWLRQYALIHCDGTDNTKQYVGIAEDITERRMMAEQHAERQRELAHVSRLSTMGEMVTSIAHELAQPLSAVLNFSGACQTLMLANETSRDIEVSAHIDQILRQAHRAGQILARLRDYVRKSVPRKSTCEISVLVSDAVELVAHELWKRGVRLQCDAPVGIHVRADRLQLEQVIVNLMRNAADAMAGTAEANRALQMSASVVDDSVILSVEDNGCGLPDTNSDSVFEAFFTTKEDGTGMGLAICRTIVEEHGGTISASNNESGGATFRVSLPHVTGATSCAAT